MRRFVAALLFLTTAGVTSLSAQTVDWERNIPPLLEPWVPWVMRGIDTAQDACLPREGQPDSKICSWVARAEVKLASRQAQVAMTVAVDGRQQLVQIPSSRTVWPERVLVNNQSVAVIEQNRRAVIALEPGVYEVLSEYRFPRIPSTFPLPKEIALVQVSVDGKRIEFPRREKNGDLWTNQTVEAPSASTVQDHLEVEVFRKLQDNIPQTLETILLLRVAGKAREISFPRSALIGEVFRIEGPLAVQVTDELFALQVQAGTWRVEVHSQLPTLTNEFRLPKIDAQGWPKSEIWALATNPVLRTVETITEKAQAVSIEQTNAPEQWQQYPLYAMDSESILQLSEMRRGGTRSTRDQLSLDKQLWLDMDGSHFTSRDSISGVIAESGRLHFLSSGQLGRVSIQGIDQYITRLEEGGPVGVEVREGALEMLAESRMTRELPLTTAWDRDFDRVTGSLMLPPGWKLFSTAGVDWTSSSWIQTWSLLDIFLVLVTAVACYRLFSPLFGIVVLAVLVLVEPEQSFAFTILCFLAAAALALVIPAGKLQRLVRGLATLGAIALSLQVLFFSIDHLRHAMYPQLRGFYFPTSLSSMTSKIADYEAEPMYDLGGGNYGKPQAPAAIGRTSNMRSAAREMVAESAMMLSDELVASPAQKARQQNTLQYVQDVNRTTQTGFGLAAWSGTRISFGWNGPVTQHESLSFKLLSPRVNLILALMRVLLLCVVVAGLFRKYVSLPKWEASASRHAQVAMIALALGICTSLMQVKPALAQSDIPSDRMLDELREYVRAEKYRLPQCAPNCSAISSFVVDETDTALRFVFTIESLRDTAVQLPLPNETWQLRAVRNGGNAVARISADAAALWIGVGAGQTLVEFDLLLPRTDELSVHFPLIPKRVEVQTEQWQAEGVNEGVLTSSGLTLRRAQPLQAVAEKSNTEEASSVSLGQTSKLQPLISVSRTIELGVTWSVVTQVQRLSPATATVQVELPLLPAESVTSAQVVTSDGKARVTIPPSTSTVSWTSTIPVSDELRLEVVDGANWSEIWRVNATNLWHVTFAGTPRIYSEQSMASGIPEWRPRSGETLIATISRPSGIEGPTTTIDYAKLSSNVGKRMQEVALEYRLRTSKGALQELILPTGAELSSLEVNGQARPLRAPEGKVRIDVAPGEQTIALRWREGRDLLNYFSTGRVDLGLPAVNLTLQMEIPNDRWVLWLRGPNLGPAVLFWAIVPVCLLVAFLLSRWPLSPLRFYEWSLLFLGLSQVAVGINIVIVAWFVLFALRGRNSLDVERPWRTRLSQLMLAGLTFAALSALFSAIRHGLLSSPAMRIAGLGSSPYRYFWFQDRIDGVVPITSVLSLDIFWYRAVMLLWALWLSFAAIRWLRWAWDAYSFGGYWPSRKTAVNRNQTSTVADAGRASQETDEPSVEGAGESTEPS